MNRFRLEDGDGEVVELWDALQVSNPLLQSLIRCSQYVSGQFPYGSNTETADRIANIPLAVSVPCDDVA
jgi:hypothetical protein